MCQLCGLPTNHDNDLELLGYITLAAWTSTALLGIWWWQTARKLHTKHKLVTCTTADTTQK